MTLSKKPYKGTRDFFPELKRERDFLFHNMRHCAELFGYESYDGPMVEEVELYKAKSGEELINDQIYSFYDRGKRFIAIRPEMTPTLARMIASVHREISKPIRWYSIPSLMRYERPQKGRLREHWQFNCDIFGAPEFDGEIEILQVAIALLESYGANNGHFDILINDRNIVNGIFTKILALDAGISHKLYKIIDKAKKISQEELTALIADLNLAEFKNKIITKYLSCQSVNDVLSLLEENQLTEEYNYFNTFMEKASQVGILEYLAFDPTIVRGLDYYTGIVFELFDKNPENRRAICGGGAYGNLLQIFNEKPLAGVGFGLGDVTLKDFLKTHKLMANFERPNNDLLMTFQVDLGKTTSLSLAQKLRKVGIKTISSFEKLKLPKAFTLAEKKGAKFIAILGDDELSKDEIQIKSLVTKEQQTFSIDNIQEITKFIKA